uniref:HAT C-terminal dimerisation domain-containing protein n=1 Tax=Rhizophora mucronata TaxID=61149 RepID=A0A2P2IYR1_RHIMU
MTLLLIIINVLNYLLVSSAVSIQRNFSSCRLELKRTLNHFTESGRDCFVVYQFLVYAVRN